MDIIGENELLLSTMGEAYVMQVLFGIKLDETPLEKANNCSERVFRLNPQSRHGFRLRAMIDYQRGNRKEAARLFKQTLASNPNDINALTWLVSLYIRAGKVLPARPLVKHLLDIDPLTPMNHSWPGWLDFIEGKGTEALVVHSRRMYEMAPDSPYSQWSYAWTLAYAGRTAEALALLDQVSQATETSFGRIAVCLRAALQNDRVATLEAITADLTKAARVDDLSSWWLTDCCSLVGCIDEALDWAENMVRLGGINYPVLSEFDPLMENARRDQRFQRLIERAKSQWEAFDD